MGDFKKGALAEATDKDETNRAAKARWGERWEQKLEAARRRFDAT